MVLKLRSICYVTGIINSMAFYFFLFTPLLQVADGNEPLPIFINVSILAFPTIDTVNLQVTMDFYLNLRYSMTSKKDNYARASIVISDCPCFP